MAGIGSGLSGDEFAGFDPKAERERNAAQKATKAAANERRRQRDIESATARRANPAPPLEHPGNSVFRPVPEEGPGGQMRLFSPSAEPEAFETKGEKRARTERTIEPRRRFSSIRATQASPGRGVSQESVRGTLGAEGVTTRGAKQRLRSHWKGAVERAGGGMPHGQDFYASEQAERFEQDAKHFGVPFNVALAVNAVMSPKTALATPSGLQTNREAAHMVMKHVIARQPGVPSTGGRGLSANAHKAAEIVRQHLEHGTHPLDAVDERGKHLLSGPKVEEYYSSYIDPRRAPTDIQHSRVLFGPKVRSELSPEETARKNEVIAEYGKNSPQVGRLIPKTPAENLLAKSGVHEWASHVTSEVAHEVGVHPSEFQSAVWHEHKTRRGGRSAVASEIQPLFAPRGKIPKDRISQSQFPGTRGGKK